MSKFLQNFIKATGPVGTYNAEEEKRRQEENESTLDKIFDTAGDIASGISNNAEYVANGISNNYDWVTNNISDTYNEYIPQKLKDTVAGLERAMPFGELKHLGINQSPISLLFSGLAGANEAEHAMQQTYAPTAAEYNYNFGKGAVSGASSVAGGIADIFGAEKTGNELNAISKLNKRDREYSGADNILSLDYLTNPSGLTYDVGNMAGSMAALYPSSFLAPATKVTSAAQTLKKLPFLRGLSDDALETMIRGSITSVPESLSEGGNVVRQAKEEGLDDPYLRGWKTAGLNLPALAISNGLEYGLLGGKIFKPLAVEGESIPKRLIKGTYRSVPSTLATSAQQGLEEYVQQGISNAQTDKEWGLLPWNASQDQLDSLLIGALTGAPMSGAASYTRYVTDQGVPKGVENEKAWEAAKIAADDIGRPDLTKYIYSQWALESGRFTAGNANRTNNFAGLKRTDTTANELQSFDSIEDFAHEYAKQTLSHYDLSNVKNGQDFARVLYDNGYFSSDPNEYGANIESIAGEIQDDGLSRYNMHTYNLSVQPGIENQIEGLTPAFKSALPYIGGILDDMGMAEGSAISSAYRTPEHNREVGGVEGSYHTKGDAVDIVLPNGITDEQAQAVRKRFEDTGAFEDVLFHDVGSGYHLHLEGYKGGLGTKGKTNIAEASVQFDNSILDFANDMLNNTDGETTEFFKDKTIIDGKGNKIFKATDDNLRALIQRYPGIDDKIYDYVNSRQKQNNGPLAQLVNTAKSSSNKNKFTDDKIKMETPNLDRLREFARQRVKTSRNPEEIAKLQSLFKNNNEDSNFVDDKKAKQYLMKNYANEIANNQQVQQQQNNVVNDNVQKVEPTSTANDILQNKILNPIQLANQTRIEARRNKLIKSGIEFAKNFTLPPQVYGSYKIPKRQEQIVNEEPSNNVEQNQNIDLEPYFNQYINTLDTSLKKSQATNTLKKILPNSEISRQERIEKSINDDSYNVQKDGSNYYLVKDDKKEKITKGEHDYFNFLKDKLNKNNKEEVQEQKKSSEKEASTEQIEKIPENFKDPTVEEVKKGDEYTKQLFKDLEAINDPDIKEELKNKLIKIRKKYKDLMEKVFTPEGKGLGIDDILAESAIARKQAIEEAVAKDKEKQSNDKVTKEKEVDVKETNVTEEKTKEENKPQEENVEKEEKTKEQKSNKKNPIIYKFNDKIGMYNGSLRGNVITLTSKDAKKSNYTEKDFDSVDSPELSQRLLFGSNRKFDVTLDEIDNSLKYAGNKYSALNKIAKEKEAEAVEQWINNATTKEEQDNRRDIWENNPRVGRYSAVESRTIDSIVRVIDNIYNYAKDNNLINKTDEVKDNGVLDEEQNRRGNITNGSKQSEETGSNEEERKSSSTSTENNRGEGQSTRGLDTNVDERPDTNGRLSGVDQTQNGSGNAGLGNDERKIEPLTTETVKEISNEPALINYRMSDKDNVGEGGKEKRYKNNIKAIKLLKQLEIEGRKATSAEQKTLAKYSGWGGMTSVFSDEKTNNELKELLTDDEYRAAKESMLSAYYTAPNVVKSIWKIVDRLGFKGGKILEPSMGVGNFFGLMPEKIMGNSYLTGVELDKISGQIATQLYQKANINITGFEKLSSPDNFFDLAIGNVPFGQFRVHDAKFNKYKFDIHNYFFAKALDKVRPGGLIVFITTKGTMDNSHDSKRLRIYLKDKADLIGAIRLPDTAFKNNTGTNVISDIIILKKRIDPLKADINAKDWIETDLIDVDERMFQMNQYYIKNPEMVAGKFTSISGRYGNDALNVSGKDIDLPKKLSEITNKIAKNVYEPLLNPVKDSKQATMEYLAPNKLRDNSYTIGKSGKVYQNINGKLEEVPKAKQKLVKDFVNVKNKLKQLLSAQVDNKISDTAISKIRTELNTLYDTFVENNGYLNNKNNSRYLATDPEYGMVSAIERYSEDKKTKKVTVGKSDIFNMRTVGLVKKPTKADSPSDALAISLREQGKVDIDYMANLVGKEPKEIVENLKGVIYKNPMTGLYETQDEYLSGNVREKLAQAEEVAKTDSSYKENIEALKKVQPVDLVPEEITVNLGASWIPASDIKQFAAETVGVNSDYIDVIYLPANGEWAVKADTWVKNNVSFTETWGISNRWSFDKLLEAALNQKRPVIKKTISENKSVVDDDATTAANNMIDNIKKAFNDWIWSDEKRTKRLLDYYNTNFNNWKLREYDGSHLTLPGYSLIAPPLRKHQKDAVWRIMQNSNTLLAHSVGAGKTWTMQTAAMEMRRLGICKKPLFVIPGHMIQQFANEFRQIYPNVQLLIVSSENLPEVTKKDKDSSRKSEKIAQRQRILTQIATEDWDGIIISHDMFKRIPMSPEAYNEFYREQENSLEQAIREINSQGDKSLLDSMVTRNLEKSIVNLKTKLKRDIAEEKKDMVIPFEELGIDQIFVDEADLFKNLSFTTKMQRVAGLSNTGSQRSMDMYLKTKYITKTNGGRGVVFATGTPISNTLAEMYTMMRYLDEDNLRKNNLLYFDNWANQFVDITQTVERNPDGNGYRAVNKASAFVNKPEMVKMFRKFADVKRPEDLHLKVPKMKTGKRIVVSVEASSALKDFITNDVKNRAEMIRQRKVDPTEDNMLKLTGELRKASLDVRLINPEVPASQAGTKISSLVDNVYKEYKDSNSTKGAQLIFCDLSTPAGVSDKNNDNVDVDTDNENDISNGKFNVYHEIKRQLIEKGIKENEIAFIHDAKTRAKKQELFDNVNNGKVRVLIGSTEKMGAGTNCQKKLVALHHLDCPWRPRDIEQREGRILRQGNENKEVGIYTYVTKDSFDANMWEKIKNKQHFISEALSADITQRIIEDNDVLAMSFAEAESLASGNPLMAEKVLIDAEVGKYTSLKNSFDKKQSRIKRELEKLPGKIENATKASEKAILDVKQHKDISGKNFSIKIGNRLFTDRKKAQLALDKITEPILKEQNKNNTKIGEIAGFDLKARFVPTSTTLYGHTTKTSGEVILTLVNNWSYEAKNSIRSIEATVNNMPQKIVETNNDIIKQSVERQKELTKEMNKKFADEDKLNELLAKQADINSKLNIGVDNNVDNNYDEDMTDNVVESEDDNVVKEENAPKKDDADFLNEHIIVGSLTKEGIKTTKSTKEKSSPEQSINVDDFDFSNEKPVKYVDTIHINKDTKEKIDNIKDIYNYYFGYDSNLQTTTGNMRKIVLRMRNRLLMIPEVSNSSAQNLKQNVKKYIEPIIKSLAKDDVDNKGKYNGFINIFKNDKLAAKKNTSPYEINPDKTIDKFADIITSMIEKKKEIEAKKGNSSDSSSGSIENVDDDKFTLDTHTDTRNGELKYLAKVKEKIDFQQLKSLAKQSGGGYSRFAKGFLFSSSEDRQKFVNAVRGITDKEQSSNYSFAEDMYKKLDEYVDIREKADFDNVKIGDYEKEISAIGDRMGTPIYWFTGPKGFRGWHSHGTTYLNVNGNWSHPKVFWHETFHWIARNNPSLFNDMLNDMKKRVTPKQIEDYRKIVWRGDKLSEDKIIEEMMADGFYDVVKRVEYLRNLGKENKSLAKRFISFIRDLMNRFTDFLNNPKARLTTTQKKSMLKNFNNLALSIVDNQGNKLFERGKDGEIKINDNRDFYSISKEEEESLIRQYGEDYMSVLFDDDEYNSQFSADNDKSVDSATGIFKGAFKNIKNRFTKNKKDERIKIYSKSAHDKKVDELGNIGGFESILSSPARLAEKYVAFKPVLTYADNAMRKLLKNRSYYNKQLNEAFDYLENKDKDIEELNDLMFKGDALSEEYGKGITDFEKRADKIVEETGVKKGTAKAYIAIRGLLNECYELINRARTQIQTKSETISKSKLEGLRQNKFVTILDEQQSEKDKDDVLVTYEIRPSHIREDVCNKAQLEALRKDEAIQILEEKEGVTEKDGSTHIYGDDYSTPKGEKINLDNNKLYTVKYREAIPKVNKLEGYVPHFFHDFYVVVQNDDGTTTTVDSGRNVKEAYKKAEQYLKDNENAKLIIRPKKFDFNEVGIDEEYYAEMVGDGAYKKINERIANEFDMSIDDVEQLLNKKGDNKNKVRRSSKHRFFGNIQHRTGAKGYEDKDLNWVLRHYFNSACRYEALETEFKPKAISYFERIYGRIGTDNKYLNGTARYIKDYINDVNGNPSALENSISTWLNNRRLWRYLFTSRYGERAALSVAGNITNKISILKLGVWNVSSAMLNLTQLLNTTALLTDKNPIKAASEVMKAAKDIAALKESQTEKRIAKLKPDERKAMEDTGVLHELGLDSGAGYSKTSFGKWGDRSMILFKASERLARCATILAAYRKARNVLNKNHDDAVKYARDINRKANFDYGVNDAPNVFRRGSIISQVLFQFMKYPIKQFELMRDFIPFNGKKDATWQQKATFWGGWIFFAGAFGLPAEDLLWALVGLISEPVFGVSPKQAVRQFLLEASKDASLPERVAIRTLLYGGLSNVGIDISSRVGMADIIPGLGEDYNKDANPIIKVAEKFGGATGGTIAQFYLNATKGDKLGMLRSISPGAYNIVTAAIIGESKDGRGRITTKYDDAMSIIIRGMGFKSTNEAIDTELGSLKYYNMNKTSKEKQNAIDDYLDAEERKENLAPYAKKLKELGVKRSTIVKARKDRKKDRRERLKEKDTPEYYQGAEALSW
ncbi:D-Ala-D-Ala carboxypeptidase family metallohydrolase [Megamonas funiformis]|uniref:D-Ala-D-Ala carboxypeptidase family metallohydrolase n=1 Tax=Megamonas funiformis TaxID=437897 RepID=UPI003F80B8AB